MKDYMSYEQFGVNFVRHAVTAERIEASITGLAGTDIVWGRAGQGREGSRRQHTGRIGSVRVVPEPDDLVRFCAVLPIDLDLDIKIGPISNRYKGLVEVPLSLSVHVPQPLTIVIEIKPVQANEIQVDVRPANTGADLLSRVGDIDSEGRVPARHQADREMWNSNSVISWQLARAGLPAGEIRPVENQFYGDRSGQFEDPFGHRWDVSTHVEDVLPEEIRRRSQEATEAMGS